MTLTHNSTLPYRQRVRSTLDRQFGETMLKHNKAFLQPATGAVDTRPPVW
jgi:hypothetical protein